MASQSASGPHPASAGGNSMLVRLPGPAAELDLNSPQWVASKSTHNILLFSQRNSIIGVHHGSLEIEYKFENHHHDILWFVADNISDGFPRQLIASYDTSHRVLIWDVYTRNVFAEFTAREEAPLNCGAFITSGRIIFGSFVGAYVIVDAYTGSYDSVQLMRGPITAIAPSNDCSRYAVGFQNGTVLICKLSATSHTILHTLSPTGIPRTLTSLIWHASPNRPRTEMLAMQTLYGDLQVWSIPRDTQGECSMIRVLRGGSDSVVVPSWFSWSKQGRILEYNQGALYVHDVRIKQVHTQAIPYEGQAISITNWGPRSLFFIVHANLVIEQWKIDPERGPVMEFRAQHLPANAPPSPPGTEDQVEPVSDNMPSSVSSLTDSETSEDEQMRYSQQRDRHVSHAEEEQERRDNLGPLSPTSSRSSASSRQSRRRMPTHLYDRPASRESYRSRDNSTDFAMSPLAMQQRTRGSETGGSRRSSGLRTEVIRSPDEPQASPLLDLFPHLNARLASLPFTAPNYGNTHRDAELLHTEMLRVAFGWQDDAESLIRDELSKHPAGSSRSVLLLKWLGELGSESIVAVIGSEAMTSSDWMLLALSSVGKDAQQEAGQTMAQRLIEKGDIHPAVAILIGIGQLGRAMETYAEHKWYMEALLLTALNRPHDWDQQCVYLRKWGEVAVAAGQPLLAVRIFSCASDANSVMRSPLSRRPAGEGAYPSPVSPGQVNRLTTKTAALKLVTTFGDQSSINQSRPVPIDRQLVEATPIAESATSPTEQTAWLRKSRREREPVSAMSGRTATPGSYNRRRQTSRGATPQLGTARTTPQTAQREFAPALVLETDAPRRVQSRGTNRADVARDSEHSISEEDEEVEVKNSDRRIPDIVPSSKDSLPSPSSEAQSLFRRGHRRMSSKDHRSEGLHLDVLNNAFMSSALSPALPTHSTNRSGYSMLSERSGLSGNITPVTAGSGEGRALEHYLTSIEQARITPKKPGGWTRPIDEVLSSSMTKPGSQVTTPARVPSRAQVERDEASQPKQKSSADDDLLQPTTFEAEGFAPAEQGRIGRRRAGSQSAARSASSRPRPYLLPTIRTTEAGSPLFDRGRSHERSSSARRSASSPSPCRTSLSRARQRGVPAPTDGMLAHGRPRRSMSLSQASEQVASQELGQEALHNRQAALDRLDPTNRTVKDRLRELAAKELEERRQSLLRRPSAPFIPLPTLPKTSPSPLRPQLPPRSQTSLGNYTSQPNHMAAHDELHSSPAHPVISTTSVPIGLPANPRAMLHGRSMSFSSRRDDANFLPPPPPPISAVDTIRNEDLIEEMLSPLLPATTYTPLDRSVSVPLEHADGQSLRSHGARTVPPQAIWGADPFTASLSPQRVPGAKGEDAESMVHDSEVVIEVDPPGLLPQLQHLARPPAPPTILPPLHTSFSADNSPLQRRDSYGFPASGEINISLDVQERAATASPWHARASITEVKSRLRNVMKGGSRTAGPKSPPQKSPPQKKQGSPYETVLPYQFDGKKEEARSPPDRGAGYVKTPKEIRAEMLGSGVYSPTGTKRGGVL